MSVMLPDWSIASIAIFLMGLLVWILFKWFSGDIVSHKQVEDARALADHWQHAWELSNQTQAQMAEGLTELVTVTETFKHFLESLPEVSKDDSSS